MPGVVTCNRSNNRGRRPQELGPSGFIEKANVLFLDQTAQHLMSQLCAALMCNFRDARSFCDSI